MICENYIIFGVITLFIRISFTISISKMLCKLKLNNVIPDRYQCGPSPVEAVKRGDVGVGFDSAFVFAEVNADVFIYVVDKKSEWGFKLAQTNTTQ